MKRSFVYWIALGILVGIGLCVSSYVSHRARLRAWLKRDPAIVLTALKILDAPTPVFVTNAEHLKGLDAGIKTSKFTPGSFLQRWDAYVQLNGAWCGQITLACNGDKMIVGAPSTMDPLEREFDYVEFEVSRQTAAFLSDAMDRARNRK